MMGHAGGGGFAGGESAEEDGDKVADGSTREGREKLEYGATTAGCWWRAAPELEPLGGR